MLLSFVIPCYNSELTITGVINEIVSKVSERNDEFRYEIVAVNDHSKDNVYSVLTDLANNNPNIKIINFAKNMGKHSAVLAAFSIVKGDIVIGVDDDGQCPIDRLWDLLKPIEDGHDVSIAKYPKKKQTGFKNFGSKVNAAMVRWALNKPKDLQMSNFIARKRFVCKEMAKYTNAFPYLEGLMLQITRDIVNVPMQERNRVSGHSGYNFKRSLKLFINGFTAFSIKPLRIATVLGAITAFIGFIFGLFVIIRKIAAPNISAGYSSMMAVLLFIGGMIMLMLGIIGEYIGRINISVNNAPQYVIRETKNIDN